MNIVYKINPQLNGHEVAAVYDDSGLRRPTDDLERIRTMIDHSNLVLAAYDNDQLIAVSRSITDFSFCCYLSDLAVTKKYQRLGIGKELMRRTKEYLGDKVMLLLLATPEAMEYYPQTGFEKVDNGWILKRLN